MKAEERRRSKLSSYCSNLDGSNEYKRRVVHGPSIKEWDYVRREGENPKA